MIHKGVAIDSLIRAQISLFSVQANYCHNSDKIWLALTKYSYGTQENLLRVQANVFLQLQEKYCSSQILHARIFWQTKQSLFTTSTKYLYNPTKSPFYSFSQLKSNFFKGQNFCTINPTKIFLQLNRISFWNLLTKSFFFFKKSFYNSKNNFF